MGSTARSIRIVLIMAALIAPGAGLGQATVSTVKKKNGQVVKGEIRGLVVQAEVRDVTAGSSSGWGALYFMIEGKTITAIDERGVHLKPKTFVRYINLGQKQKPDDLEVLTMYRSFDAGDPSAMLRYSTSHDMAAVSVNSLEKASPSALSLLGELRVDKGTVSLIPAIEIATEGKRVAIPLSEIVDFKLQPPSDKIPGRR